MLESLLAHYGYAAVLVGTFLEGETIHVIAASGLPTPRFIVLNGIGAAVWAITVACLGYLLGESAARVIDEVRHYEVALIVAIAIAGAAVWAVHVLRRRTPRAWSPARLTRPAGCPPARRSACAARAARGGASARSKC